MAEPLAPCDHDVYVQGEVLHYGEHPKEEAEAMVKRMRLIDHTHLYDWHYVAGRAVFKRLAKAALTADAKGE